MVALGFVTACRRARVPTLTGPLCGQLTHDGIVRSPSAATIVRGTPFSSRTATQEFVVPRSMPMIRDTLFLLTHEPRQQALAFVRSLPAHFRELARGAFVR